MRTICRAWCFLFGHKVFEPTGGVQACHLCHDAREWNVAGFTAREFTGIVRWPFYCIVCGGASGISLKGSKLSSFVTSVGG